MIAINRTGSVSFKPFTFLSFPLSLVLILYCTCVHTLFEQNQYSTRILCRNKRVLCEGRTPMIQPTDGTCSADAPRTHRPQHDEDLLRLSFTCVSYLPLRCEDDSSAQFLPGQQKRQASVISLSQIYQNIANESLDRV